ncbi:fimbrial protein [uncultured Parabacteroides sp.]|uniref:fimbrial protein n=1 Tax=uncultured Parabacteroides sp. TaxID=512312 RepID=UPI0025CF92C6|nr:fimbrial protein [uncultured Parabacteroides sp.]
MKRYINIIGFLFCLFAWNACTDDDLVKKEKAVIDGIPTTVSLSFTTQDADRVATKSEIDVTEEYRVYDMCVFVFRQVNNVWVKELMTNVYTTTSEKGANGGTTAGTVILPVTSGTKRIYAVANGVDNPLMPIANLESVNTLDDFMALTAVLGSPTVERGQSHLVMSGMFETGNNVNGEVVISPEDNNKTLSSGKVKLKHLDSKITFEITAADGITFTPREWRVVNVPVTSYVVEKTYLVGGENHDAVGYSAAEDYFTSPLSNFEKAIGGDVTKGGSFTFYMLENRKNALGNITSDAKTKGMDAYQLREKQEKENPRTDDGGNKVVDNGDYIYAAKYATYVEMTGSFHQDATETDVEKSAEVKYTIHLGYENKDASNFRSRRACDYTYNVRVTGVDAIEVEVETSDQEEPTEEQPGAEGDVIKSKTYLYVDAHYETKSITFSKALVSKEASFRVKTPYDINGIGEDASDYEWVWFVQNEKIQDKTEGTPGYYEYSERKLAYSGYTGDNLDREDPQDTDKKSYLIPRYLYQKREWIPAVPGVDNGWKYKKGETNFARFINDKYVNTTGDYSGNGYVGKRINVKDLIKLLQTHKEEAPSATSIYDAEGNAAFTVFIDEFYYENDAQNWKKFVNVPNREMHILCDTRYSQDQESSLTTSNFLISQKSIKTFYDLDNVSTAWGVETIREGDMLMKGTINPSNSSKTNGRWNMYSYMKYTGKSWNTYVQSSSNTLTSNYNRIAYACLQRNRDLNGNGTIEDNEVRWYLPSINQMVGMWTGRNGFSSSEVYLFNGDPSTITDEVARRKYHFQNSSDVMFWAEEGAATGNNNNDNPLDYRCVRNLGAYYNDTPERGKEPSDYVKYDSNTRIFDLTNMNSKAIRSELYTGELAVTDELNQANRPYKYFKVAKNLSSETITQKQVYSGQSPCTAYSEIGNGSDKGTWRMPNQRELMLIVSYISSTDQTLSRTRSALALKKNSSYGSIFYQQVQTNSMNIIGLYAGRDDTKFPVRCVKDVPSK